MTLTSKILTAMNHFLMMDVYKEASEEDRAFLDILLFVARMINSLKSPISLAWFLHTSIKKYVF